MKYEVLVLDIDGTLTNSAKEISPKTKQALDEIQQRGVKVVLASGRPTCGVEPVAKEIGLEKYGGYILSFNGGKIINVQTGQVIYQKIIPQKIIPQLCRFAKSHRATLLSYENDTIITTQVEDRYVEIEARINKMNTRQVENLAEYITFPVNKCMIVGDGERLGKLEEQAIAELGDSLNIYRSEPYFLEFMPQDIDKAYSLGRLLEYLGLTKDKLMACGDGFNDISMIDYAGLGVAMENAQPAVKLVADYITTSNDQDGVAKAIQKFMPAE